MNTKKQFLILAATLLLFAGNLFAQTGVGTLNFRILGLETGDRAVVSFGSDSYLDTKTISANGDYVFENIPAGRYFIKIEATGYNLPNAQTVVVNQDGSVEPMVGIQLVITKKEENPNLWTHSWSEDVSNSGYTTTAYINNPPTIEFLGKKIVPSDVPFSGVLKNNYNIILSDEEEAWTQEYTYRLVETLKTIPCFSAYAMAVGDIKPSMFVLTEDYLYQDIEITKVSDTEQIVRISKACFIYANPFLVNLDGVRGRFFSKRLHHALVNFATDFGNDLGRVNTILRERFGCTTQVPDYSVLTAGTTNEDAGRFQAFNPGELVSILNMFEELPTGFHKTPHLNYLVRRMNGHQHPLYPNAAAVAWCIENNGYIEFMETAFGGDANGFETQRLILHEKAHFLWAFTFSEEIKNDWIELGGWYKDPNSGSGWSTTNNTEFVSPYAHAINPDEDMAESIAHYLKNPELLQSRALPKFEFIRDRIMHGVRYISKIPDHLTFEVLNLFPDYDYPGKIKRLDVKVEGAPDEDKIVTVEIELNNMEGFDDGASGGGTRIVSPIFIDTDGQRRSQFVDIGFSPVDGNPHILRGSARISKYSKTGFWTAGDIIVTDLQNNQRLEGRNDFVWNMYVNNLLEDLDPPKYEEGSLSYQVTDTIVEGRNAQNLRITYKITDNIGISGTYGAVNRDGALHSIEAYGRYDIETQTAIIDMLMTEYQPSGYYWVVSLVFSDFAGNGKYIYFSDSPLDQPIQRIYIETPNPDTEAPEVDLNRITIYAEPTNPDNPDGETIVTINYYARDNKSGLGLVGYRLRDPQGIPHGNYHYHRNFYTRYFDGDPTVWEKYTINIVLPKGSAPGIWGLAELSVLDKVQNGRIYNFVETLIFEPDNSTTDYVLFAELNKNNIINMEIASTTENVFGFTYRIINEDTGEEISGEVNNEQPQYNSGLRAHNSTNLQQIAVDVSSLSAGKLIIIVQIKNDAGEIVGVRSGTVIKNAPTIPVSSIKLNEISLNLLINQTEQLTSTVLPENATNKNVLWESSNTDVAEVSSTGLVTAKSAGTATITVTTEDSGLMSTCEITVTAPTYGISIGSFFGGSISSDKVDATAGETVTLSISPNEGYELNVISIHKTGEETTAIALSGSGTTRTFTMPEYGVTVTATFKKSQETLDAEAVQAAKTAIENTSYAVVQATANTEAEVKTWLTAQINSLIASTGISVTDDNITLSNWTTASNGINGSFSFTVAIAKGSINTNATKNGNAISATPVYNVLVATMANGNVSADKITVVQGETVTLTVSPTTGYELDAISAHKTGEETTSVTLGGSGNNRTFTMPTYGVTVTATFKKSQATLDSEAVAAAKTTVENGSYSVAQTTANTESAVKTWLAAQINSLIASTGISVTDANITLSNFTAANSGENGSFGFTVVISKGSANASATKTGSLISATPVYNVLIATMTNGSVSADKTTVVQGETVTLTISPTTGYELDAISAHRTGEETTGVMLGGSGNIRTFTMPAYGVMVIAIFKKSQETLDFEAVAAAKTTIENGSYSVAQTTANTESTVKTWLTAQINSLIASTGISVTKSNITLSNFTTASSGENGNFGFTVAISKGSANANATKNGNAISATPVYNVLSATMTNGNVSADKTTVVQGETVTLTISPATGYELDAISAHRTSEETTNVTFGGSGTTRTFIMPEYGVTVTATFKKSQKTLDTEAVEAAKTAIENASYAVAQATANTEAEVKIWLATQINSLIASTGISVTDNNITLSNFITANNGENGSFGFTVAIAKGSVNTNTTKNGSAISATPVYNVLIATMTSGNLSVDKTTVVQGETVTLTISPATGYELDTISAHRTGEETTSVTLGGSGNNRTFTMPAYGVTVTATFKKSQATLDSEAVAAAKTTVENDSYSVAQTTANTESAVKTWLAAQINSLIASTGISVTDDNITLSNFTAASNGKNGNFGFTIAISKGSANANATKNGNAISATPVYNVLIATMTNGSVSANKTTVVQGETVTLTIAPVAGYELEAIAAHKTGEVTTSVTLNGTGNTHTFTMPAYGVTVTATFKKSQEQLDRETIEVTKAAIEGGSYSIAQATGNTEAEVKLWLFSTLNVLFGQSHGVEFRSTTSIVGNVTITALTPAVAGTKTNPEGINGSFEFAVTLAKGETSLISDNISGVILATPYTEIPMKSIELMQISDLTVHIINTGNIAINKLTLELSGVNADVFSLSTTTINGLDVGDEAEITFIPYTGLAEGIYTAILTVNGEGMESKSIEITYDVTIIGKDNIQVKNLNAWVHNGTLHVKGLTAGEAYYVHNVSGLRLYQGIANSDEADISLFVRGVYFVQSGNKTVKVVY